ncbi:MAG TPA: hypothetical protein PKX52_04330 [Methanomassiliicoccaceae archaeon]|nr:hypothetical protein [Methanomassiliicoccaceae archaeon]
MILLVEDDPNDAELIMRAFRRGKLSTNVVHLRDGEEAVRYVAGEHVRQHEKWSPPEGNPSGLEIAQAERDRGAAEAEGQ